MTFAHGRALELSFLPCARLDSRSNSICPVLAPRAIDLKFRSVSDAMVHVRRDIEWLHQAQSDVSLETCVAEFYQGIGADDDAACSLLWTELVESVERLGAACHYYTEEFASLTMKAVTHRRLD